MIDYKAFFEQSSEMIIVMDTQFIIVEASDEYLRSTKTVRENIVGRYVFDVFSDNPNDISADGESKLIASFNRVIKTKITQTISVIKYDIQKPASEGGGFEPKYWKTTQSPILDANNNVKYIIQRLEDVTEDQTLIKQLDFEKKALKQIEDSEKRYNLMLMKSPFAFAVFKGKDMVIALANDSIKKMWRKGNDVEEKSIFEVLPEIVGTSFPDLLHAVYTTGIPFYGNEFLVELQHADKLEDTYFNFVYQPYLEADETISGVTVIAYEVTAQVILKKALEVQQEAEKKSLLKIKASEERFRLLVQQAPVAICVFRGKNFLTEIINKPMAEMVDRKPEEILNKPFFDVLTEVKDQGFIELLENVYNTGERFVAQELPVNINRNGKLENVFVRFVYEPFREADGTISGVMALAHEITEQVVARRTAEAAVIAKQQFLSNMSHEIRTPMNAIVGFTHVVLKTDLNKAQKEYLKAIKVSGDALIVLINDILDLAQVDAGKMTFQQLPFNLSDSISDMLNLFEIKLKEKNIILIKNYGGTVPEVLVGDPIRLRQIILNLLSNAVKFTEKGTITIGVHLLNENSEKVTLEFNVTDTGIGIPENKLPHIFGNFEQVHTDKGKSFGGTGLGLAIFKQLVEHQGGSISVKSKEGAGSTFSFIMPFKKTNTKMPVEPETILIKPSEIKKAKVLVAEDVALNQLLIKIIVEDFGFEVDIAGTGKMVIEKLKENNYDIILMDLQMPEMDGFEATTYIRNTMNSQIPIIALTADVTAADVEKSKVVGMNDYISKPIDEKLLYSKILEHLRQEK